MIFSVIIPRPDDAGRERITHYMTEGGGELVADAVGSLAAEIEKIVGLPCGVELCGNFNKLEGRPFFTLTVMPRIWGRVNDGQAVASAQEV